MVTRRSAFEKLRGDDREVHFRRLFLASGPPVSRERRAVNIMDICKREPTIEELLFDPMMSLMFDHGRTTAEDVRAMIRDVRDRLATIATYDASLSNLACQT
jgi:hypothetical protein